MLHFLRRIRRSLINSGATRKYLLYAVGEILLVMIGILLALQVNNWNQSRITTKMEMQFLLRLEKDLISDTIYLNRRLSDSKKLIAGNGLYIKESYKKQESIEDYRKLLQTPIWNSEHFVTQNTMYLELVNSGQINILHNQELKEKMVSFYKKTEIAATHIKEYNEWTAAKLLQIRLIPWKYIESFSNIFDNPEMFHKDEWEYINNPRSDKFRIFEQLVVEYIKKHELFQ